MELIEKSHCN